ncbi:MAG: glucose-1-phosphate adenylyltransferase subunit GlgD [Clostridiales bacterium]|jgi:glucose-1-phosphate adenylyltransferase|nr:glucose-1-phosphate adenylyltransferase subunit GlgD [Clostridiales bacterium]
MRGNNVVGILFSNVHDEKLRELTEKRTIASVPFGGRYRLIDFPLSNMVNSGINKVGVVTKSNYQSLMDHLGSGKAWDLSRKREGLYLLPPFDNKSDIHNSRVESLHSIRRFLLASSAEFVLLSDCDIVCNINYSDLVDFHIQRNADLTVVYHYGKIPDKMSDPTVYSVEPDGQVKDLLINPKVDGACNYGLNMYLARRDLLIQIVDDCVSRNMYSFKRDLLQRNMFNYRYYAYEFSGYSRVICSPLEYYQANMDLMDPEIRTQLFNPKRPIYTKVRDDMPARYGLGSCLNNSLVADGCVIEGEVDNCVLFRGVKVGKGTKLENCVIMQDTVIGANCNLNHVIVDKDVLIKDDRSLMGFESYPVFISKGSVV